MSPWLPPALDLRPQSEIRALTALKAMLDAERYWPREILTNPSVLMETTSGPLLFLTDPFLVREAVMRNDGTLPRSRLQQRFAGHGTGRENVIAETGPRSIAHRQTLAPLFLAQRLPQYFSFIQSTINHALFPAAQSGQTVDVGRLCVQATFGVVWQILFGSAQSPVPPQEVTEIADNLYDAGLSGYLTATSKAVESAKIRSLELRPEVPLVEDTPFARTPRTSTILTDQELEDNAQFLLTAGHESTALTITWALWILSQQPDLQETVSREIDQATQGSPITFDSLRAMPVLGRVLDETMRLYPSAIVVNREAVVDLSLGTLSVAKGTQVAVCFYGMHRHRAYWDNPDAFIPDRFLPEAMTAEQKAAFLPFSAGRHSCLGGHLAWTEAMVVLATLLQRFRLFPGTDELRPIARYTLRPSGPVQLQLEDRQS